MRSLVATFAALSCMSTLTLAQSPKPQIISLYPESPGSSAIVIPSGSPMQIASLPRDGATEVAFRGRFTLSGIYKLEGYGEEASATIWPDGKSRDALPYWQGRDDGPEEIFIHNGWAFAEAVVPKDKLQKLKANKLSSVTGRVTIIADDYQASIDCDVATFSARFVSVVKVMQIAAKPNSEEKC